MRGVPSQPRRDPRRSPRVTRPLPAGSAARSPGAAPPRSGRTRPAPAGAVRGGSRCVGRAESPHGPAAVPGGFPYPQRQGGCRWNPRLGGGQRDEAAPRYLTVDPRVHTPTRGAPRLILARLKARGSPARRKAGAHGVCVPIPPPPDPKTAAWPPPLAESSQASLQQVRARPAKTAASPTTSVVT